MEAIETVNIVTSSFDADQGMAGGASVNVQVKSGTNTLKGLAFEYFNHGGDCARATTSCRRTRTRSRTTRTCSAGRVGGPIKKNKLFYFASVESTVQRTRRRPLRDAGLGVGDAVPVAAADGAAQRRLLAVGHGDLRPADRQRQRHRPRPVRVPNCPRSASVNGPRLCRVQLHPGRPHLAGGAQHQRAAAGAAVPGRRRTTTSPCPSTARTSTRSTRR